MDSLYSESSKFKKLNDIFILFLLPLGLILSDWIVTIFSVGEFVFLAVIFLLLFSKNVFLIKKDYLIICLIFIYLSVNFYLNAKFNDDFIFKSGRAATIKIMYYSVFVLMSYRFVIYKKLETKLLKFLNMYSIAVILVGLYIIFAIYTGKFPFEFIWEYTRTDKASYIYKDTIRMRSVFSEPAHLGFYLNLNLGLNLFLKNKIKLSRWFNPILLCGVVLTFSYSSIAISLVLILLSLFIRISKKGKISLNTTTYIYIILMAVIIYISRDFLYRTLILRTFSIINGEDGSALNRFFGSWEYVNQDNFLIGNGAGNTPPITNNFAYMLSDLGTFALLISIVFTYLILRKNLGLGFLFILLNFQKGGYLSPSLSILVVFTLIFINMSKEKHYQKNLLQKHSVYD